MFTDNDKNYREKWPDLPGAILRKVKKFCSVEGLYQRFPVFEWLPKYKKSFILPDIVAGLTVAMTVIPQGIADAALAGLPTQYGLYAGFMGKLKLKLLINIIKISFYSRLFRLLHFWELQGYHHWFVI